MSKKLLLVTKMDDDNYNLFKFDTSLTPKDKTVTLTADRRGDNTSWDGITDWGDGTLDTNTTHTYTNDGIYLVKTKYILDESNGRNNNTREKLIDCININKNIKDCSNMFSGCINVVEFTNSSNWDTSNATSMNAMFSQCSGLTTLDLSNFDTSKVTSMGEMFSSCGSLTTLNINNFNTSNVTDMHSMFDSCSSLATLNISNFDTTNVSNMKSMFAFCSKLTILDISNFNMDKVTNTNRMFANCPSLHQSGLTMTNCNEATKNKINSMVQV